MIKNNLLAIAAVAALMAPVTAANAVIDTFASSSPKTALKTVRWKNSAGNGANTNSGVGGSIYTTGTGTSTNIGSTLSKFTFFQSPLISFIENAPANFKLSGITTTATSVSGTNLSQGGISGSFSFTAPVAYTSNCLGTCTNLLTGTFTGARLFGVTGEKVASLQMGTVGGASLAFTSDFLDFSLVVDRSAGFVFDSLSNALTVAAGKSFRTTRGTATGLFGSDPAPVVNGVPEPEMWALMIVGFGLVGVQVRRSNRRTAVAA